MKTLNGITFNPEVMGGKPCIRGLRVTAGTIVGLVAAGRSRDEILKSYPYLEPEDIEQALAYAAWRVEEIDVPVITAWRFWLILGRGLQDKVLPRGGIR
jgi:uncharacterized protein (DUF433 family)